jgi:hypothetical protein
MHVSKIEFLKYFPAFMGGTRIDAKDIINAPLSLIINLLIFGVLYGLLIQYYLSKPHTKYERNQDKSLGIWKKYFKRLRYTYYYKFLTYFLLSIIGLTYNMIYLNNSDYLIYLVIYILIYIIILILNKNKKYIV